MQKIIYGGFLMKKLLVVLASVVFATGLFAHEAGNTQLSIAGSVGLGFASGEAAFEAQSGVTVPYTVGIQAGYFLSDSIAILFGVGYGAHPVMLVDKDDTDTGLKFTQGFVDLSAGLRGYMSGLFLGAGFTYGIKTGDREMYAVVDGEETKKGDLRDKVCKNNASLYLEAGFAFPVSDDMTFDLGLKLNIGLVNSIEEEGFIELKAHSLDFTLGLSFLF